MLWASMIWVDGGAIYTKVERMLESRYPRWKMLVSYKKGLNITWVLHTDRMWTANNLKYFSNEKINRSYYRGSYGRRPVTLYHSSLWLGVRILPTTHPVFLVKAKIDGLHIYSNVTSTERKFLFEWLETSSRFQFWPPSNHSQNFSPFSPLSKPTSFPILYTKNKQEEQKQACLTTSSWTVPDRSLTTILSSPGLASVPRWTIPHALSLPGSRRVALKSTVTTCLKGGTCGRWPRAGCSRRLSRATVVPMARCALEHTVSVHTLARSPTQPPRGHTPSSRGNTPQRRGNSPWRAVNSSSSTIGITCGLSLHTSPLPTTFIASSMTSSPRKASVVSERL